MSATQVPAKARAAVQARSGGRCEACGQSPAVHMHHRDARGMGGTTRPAAHSPANLLHLCERCHLRVEAHLDPLSGDPADMYTLGLLVTTGTDPATVPVRLWHGVYGPAWWQLHDDGLMSYRSDQQPTVWTRRA